ncbi:rhodanese-like domain-containing protein [Mycoplasmatota bacterium]|nr:rhodanese-like domain-containing protein [Mycoplasmatota bacterium]
MNKKFFIIIGSIFVVLIAGIIILSLNDQTIKTVDGDKVRQILDENPNNSVFIDVRSSEEHQENGIDSSIVIPYNQIEAVIKKYYPDKNTHIIVYCNTGNKSRIAANTLKSLGYKNIYDMGSYKNWE